MSFRLVPSMSADTRFFWDGLKAHRLLLQRCTECGGLRHPPRPMCPSCNALGWDVLEASGRGTVHSFVMPQHPQFPFMEYPYIVALVELEERTRLLSNLCEIAPEEATIGMPVEVFFEEFDDGLVLHQFRPAGAR
jgi:uncharacterized OB-fold protein